MRRKKHLTGLEFENVIAFLPPGICTFLYDHISPAFPTVKSSESKVRIVSSFEYHALNCTNCLSKLAMWRSRRRRQTMGFSRMLIRTSKSHRGKKCPFSKEKEILREIHMPSPCRHSSRSRPPSLWNADRRKRMGKARIPRSVLSGMAYIALLICSIFPRCPYVSPKRSSHSGNVRTPACHPFISQF